MIVGLERKYAPMIICGQGILHFGVLLNPMYLVTHLGVFFVMHVISL
jgi:hypothetical protein